MKTPETIFICSSKQSRDADQYAMNTQKIPSLSLMENAAQSIADFILEHAQWQTIQIICGSGNNGGDGLAAARLLHQAGRNVSVYLSGHKKSADCQHQLESLQDLPVSLQSLTDFVPKGDLIVDALFGSGLNRDLDETMRELIRTINSAPIPTLAIDIPSGLSADTGKAMPVSIRAAYTIALDCLKQGEVIGPGHDCCGTLLCADIGIDPLYHLQNFHTLNIDENSVREFLMPRPENGHKGTFGKVLLCAGSLQMSGAAVYAATACFKAGAGLVSVFCPEKALPVIASKSNLAMLAPGRSDEAGFFTRGCTADLYPVLERCDCFAAGNGIGIQEGSQELVRMLVSYVSPLVLDADALGCLALHTQWIERGKGLILTPHLGEFSRLSGWSIEDLEANPIEAARQWCQEHDNCVLVLKSDITVVGWYDQLAVLDSPCCALSKGGSGDVLCGLIAGLIAPIAYSFEMSELFEQAVLGVWIHNAAAHLAASDYTFTPEDLIENFTPVFQKLSQTKNSR